MEKYEQWCKWFYTRHGYMPTKVWVDTSAMREMFSLAFPYSIPLTMDNFSLCARGVEMTLMGIRVDER